MITRILFLLALLSFSTVAIAQPGARAKQQPVGAIRLEVKDPSGNAMAAYGKLESVATGASRSFQTDAQGKYTFDALAYGRYRLEVSTEENLIDFTPELREEAKQILQKYDHGPIFTPPSEKGAIALPGWGGGANWWGAAFDPETNILYVPSITAPILIKLNKVSGEGSNLGYARSFAQNDMNVAGPRGLPLFKPPYGRITAINLNAGEHVWQTPNGDGARREVNEILKGMGVNKDVGPLGAGGSGPLLTKTLLFIAQGAGGRGGRSGGGANFLRAFDKATGKVVAEIELPFMPFGSPMTYMAKGKQYIVLSLGDLRLAALSLP